MARRRLSSGIPVSLGPDGEPFIEPDEPPGDAPPLTAAQMSEEEEEDRDLLQGLRELTGSGEIRWQVYRNSLEPGRGGHVATLNTSQLSIDYIGQRFGGGKYRIRGTYPSGQFAAHRTIEIAEDVVRDPKYAPGAMLQAAAPAAPGNMLEYVKVIGPIMAPIIAAMISNKGPDVAALIAALKPPPAPTMPEMMTALASLKALAPEQTTTPLDNALKLLEVIKDQAGSATGETNWLDILKTAVDRVGPSLGLLIEKLPAPQAAYAPQTPRLSAPALNPGPQAASTAANDSAKSATENSGLRPAGPPDPPPSSDDTMLQHLGWLKNQLTFLIVKAAKNSDPELYAELFCDNLPDGFTPQQVKALLLRDDWWQFAKQIVPDIHPYEGWFAQLRGGIVANFQEGDAEPEENPGNIQG